MTEQQVEEIKFAKWGFRVALLGDDGRLELESDLDAEQYGHLLPAVGDTICAIGPGRYDGRPLEVVKRFYVTEFGGETCWWIIVREVQIDDLMKATFKLARREARAKRAREKESEPAKSSYETLLEIRERLKSSKSPVIPRRRQSPT